MVWGAAAHSRPLSSLPWVATSRWGLETVPWRKQCQLLSQTLPWQEEKYGLYLQGSVAPALGRVLPVGPHGPMPKGSHASALPWEFCMFRCALSSTTTELLSQSQGGIGTGVVSRHSLQLLQFLGATNISVNKEVCLFRVFLTVSCPR